MAIIDDTPVTSNFQMSPNALAAGMAVVFCAPAVCHPYRP